MSCAETRDVFIIYGSQTGNGESIATDFCQELQDLDIPARCMHLNDLKKSGVNLCTAASYAIFVCSTTGNGDAPENCCSWWRSVKTKSAAKDMFAGLSFTVLGLGDTNYDKFCFMGKAIDKRLSDLGGHRAHPLVCADEATDFEAVIEGWKTTIKATVQAIYKPVDSQAVLEDTTAASAGGASTKSDDDRAGPGEPQTPSTPLPMDRICGGVLSRSLMNPEKIAEWVGLNDPAFFEEQDTVPARAKKGPVVSYVLKPPSTTAPVVKPAVSGSNEPSREAKGEAAQVEEWTAERPFVAHVASAHWLTSTHNRALSLQEGETSGPEWGSVKRVVHVDVSLEGSGIMYTPGDSMGIMRPNPPEIVALALERLNKGQEMSGSSVIVTEETVVEKMSDNGEVLQKTTVGEILYYGLDFVGPPRKNTVLALSAFCTDWKEQTIMKNLCGKGGSAKKMWNLFVEDQCINVGEMLALFPSCVPTLGDLVRSMTPLPPRYFSIASSPLAKQNKTFSFAFSIVRYTAKLSEAPEGKEAPIIFREGFCTSSLEKLLHPWLHPVPGNAKSSIKAPVRIFHKPSPNFQLPGSISSPLMLVGPGTGVAPFVGFLEHRMFMDRNHNRESAACKMNCGTWRGDFELEEEDLPDERTRMEEFFQSADPGPIHLFFGCRDEHDRLYKAEIDCALNSKVLTSAHIAMSRVGPEKVYVSHKIREQGEELAKLITEKQGYVYVCGDGNQMAKDVHAALKAILIAHSAMNEAQVEQYLKDMRTRKRYLLDVWS